MPVTPSGRTTSAAASPKPEIYFTPAGIRTVVSSPLYRSSTPSPAITNSSVSVSKYGVPLNAQPPISRTPDGIESVSSDAHARNACAPMLRRLSGSRREGIAQPKKAPSPMETVDSLSVMRSSASQPENVRSAISVTPAGSAMLFSALHSQNAPWPMRRRLSGSITLSSVCMLKNALSPISVTPSGSTTLRIGTSERPYWR